MALTIEQLGVTLDGRAALDGISARIERGRVTAVLGPNGAGKSTLLRAVIGLVAASGSVAIEGRALDSLTSRERARTIGYLPQQAVVHWNLRVADLIALGRMPHHGPFAAPGTEDRAAVDQAMIAADVISLADRLVDTLSGGERARVLLARVLAGQPDWLLADEPLASLDPAHQLDLLERLAVLARQGTGVVIVLHDLAHAARVADDVIVLQQGRVLAQGTAAAMLTPDLIRRAYGIDVAMLGDGDRRIPVPIRHSLG